MHFRKTFATAAILALFAGCDQSATDTAQTEQSSEFAVQAALVGSGLAFNDGAPSPAIFGRLVHAAIGRIAHDSGAAVARAAGESLKPLVETARTARAGHDTVAAKAAMEALRQAEAAIVVKAFGTEVVTRTIAFASDAVDHLNARIAAATANDADRPRLTEIAANITQMLADAKASAAAGDNVSALISATKVVEALHIVRAHRELGRPGALPLDTTRVRPGHP
jgi:hypothetical protein